MQPVQNLLFLTHTRIPKSILAIFPASMPSRSLIPRIITLTVVRLLPPTANEQHITDLDVTALCGRSNIDTLVFAALVQLFPGNGIVVERIIIDAFLLRVASVVEQDAATSDAVLCPVVDGALVVCGGAGYICAFGLEMSSATEMLYERENSGFGKPYAVVKASTGNMRKVSEAIPLGSGLRVHGVQVIICNPFVESFDLVLEYFATECWLTWHVEGKTEADMLAPAFQVISDGIVHITYFTFTISPLLISRAAAATRVGVSRFKRPIYVH